MGFYIYLIVNENKKCYDVFTIKDAQYIMLERDFMNTPTINTFSKASLVLGIITIVTVFMGVIYIPFITGGIAIILALLSRGRRRSFSTPALIGVITSCVGLVLNVALVVTSLVLYSNVPEVRNQVNSYLEQMTGIEIEDDATLSDIYNNLLQ